MQNEYSTGSIEVTPIYTIEKHLEEASRINSEFCILDSIWKLNKRNLPAAQNNINANFPHYSAHDESHSLTIIRNIEKFLGEDRIKRLSPTDSFMLLMSAYTHDIGMVVFYSALELNWSNSEFDTFLDSLKNGDDVDLSKAALLVTSVRKGIVEDGTTRDLLLPLKIRQAVTLINGEYFRRNHFVRSKNAIQDENDDFSKVSSGYFLDALPNRFKYILGRVAYSHGVNFLYILDHLEQISDGYAGDKMHPRFIASMLRLGDVLDIDDKRFNIYSEKVFGKELPNNSTAHKKKHSSIRHLLISPSVIEATANCADDDVYRITREWFNWIENEVYEQKNNWTLIAPSALTGGPPNILKGSIKVFFNDIDNPIFSNLKFRISQKKALELIEGDLLYEESDIVFLRELIQNALDANKAKQLMDIKEGYYDQFILQQRARNNFEVYEPTNTPKDLSNVSLFKSDIPSEVSNRYSIELDFYWREGDLEIKVKDQGIGISDEELLALTESVGESKHKLENKDKEKWNLYWLKPTGAFGIGLQSVFRVTDSFDVITSTGNGKQKHIKFRSAKKGRHSSIIKEEHGYFKSGTTVVVKLPIEKLEDVFGSSFSFSVIGEYDYFTHPKGFEYLHKLIDYTKKTLMEINSLSVSVYTPDKFVIKHATADNSNIESNNFSLSATSPDKKIRSKPIFQKDSLIFAFEERTSDCGSTMFLSFDTSFQADHNLSSYPKGLTKLYIRDIPVTHHVPSYYETSYLGLVWNILGIPSSDLLNLSREKLLSKGRKKLSRSFIGDLFPKAIELVFELFAQLYDSTGELKSEYRELTSNYRISYFFATLSFFCKNHSNSETLNALDNPSGYNPNILSKLTIPIQLCRSTENLNAIHADQFFKAECFLKIEPRGPRAWKHDEQWSAINKLIIDHASLFQEKEVNVILVNGRYFDIYLVSQFFATEKFRLISDGQEWNCTVLRKKTFEAISKFQGIHMDTQLTCEEINSLVSSSTDFANRKFIYAIAKHADKLMIRNRWFWGFEQLPAMSEFSIISPFRSNLQKNEFQYRYEAYINLWNENTSVKEVMDQIDFSELISPTLIKEVSTHRFIKSSNTDSESVHKEIFEAYVKLIIEYFCLQKKPVQS